MCRGAQSELMLSRRGSSWILTGAFICRPLPGLVGKRKHTNICVYRRYIRRETAGCSMYIGRETADPGAVCVVACMCTARVYDAISVVTCVFLFVMSFFALFLPPGGRNLLARRAAACCTPSSALPLVARAMAAAVPPPPPPPPPPPRGGWPGWWVGRWASS